MWRWNSRVPFIENGYYHIYNRWFNKWFIFTDKSCFEHFYKLILKYKEEYINNLKLVSYCLLPNHFHFVIYNMDGTGTQISDFMKKLQWGYSIWYRVKYPLDTGTKLPFFEWRFKAKLIKDEQYLQQCLVYVNYNAIKHEIVKDINDYSRTSYHQLENKDKIDQYKDLILDELEF